MSNTPLPGSQAPLVQAQVMKPADPALARLKKVLCLNEQGSECGRGLGVEGRIRAGQGSNRRCHPGLGLCALAGSLTGTNRLPDKSVAAGARRGQTCKLSPAAAKLGSTSQGRSAQAIRDVGTEAEPPRHQSRADAGPETGEDRPKSQARQWRGAGGRRL